MAHFVATAEDLCCPGSRSRRIRPLSSGWTLPLSTCYSRRSFVSLRQRGSFASALVEFSQERGDAALDLVTGGADFVDRPALRIREVPVDVPLAREVRALIAAAHGDHDV